MYSILSPHLSEKSTIGMENGLYVLNVTSSATKNSIEDDLKKLFKVDPISVRIVNLPAKNVRFRFRKGVRSVRRRAYVQLKAGQTLPGFEIKKEAEKKEKK